MAPTGHAAPATRAGGGEPKRAGGGHMLGGDASPGRGEALGEATGDGNDPLGAEHIRVTTIGDVFGWLTRTGEGCGDELGGLARIGDGFGDAPGTLVRIGDACGDAVGGPARIEDALGDIAAPASTWSREGAASGRAEEQAACCNGWLG